MAINASSLTQKPTRRGVAQLLGGYAALAESAWMGFPQASDVLDGLRAAPGAGRRLIVPRLPHLQIRGLLTRELTVAEASFVLMVSFFTSALLGAVRQILFNAQFGVGMDANAYYAAFRLPDTLFSLIAGGALSSAMIPVLLTAERAEGRATSLHLIRLVLTGVLGFFALLVLAVELFTPAFVNNILAPGFDLTTAQLTVNLTRIMLIQPLILAIGSVATAVLNSRNQFLLGALALVSHNVALILGILAARVWPELGIYGPTLGVVVGALFQVLILSPGLREVARQGWLAWEPAHGRLREVVRLLVPNGLSLSVNYAGSIVDTAFATQAMQTAALGAIYNAWLLVGLPIALLGQAVGQAVFPRLAAHAEAEKWALMRRTLLQSLGVVAALAVVALLSLLYLGRPTIRILFERGEFGAAAGDLTYLVLVAYAVALPAYVATEVISRGLIALRDTRTPLLTNLLQLGGRTAIMALFVGRFGVVTIPAALAVTATLEAFVLGTVLLTKLQARQ